jgi:fumarylacetoacetase
VTWAPVPAGSDFPLENLPFGVVRPRGERARTVVRIGDHVLDLAAAAIEPELTDTGSLNALLESGRTGEVRARAAEFLTGSERADVLHGVHAVDVLLPFVVGDFVDFYASIHHASNLGRILRPESPALLPNWRELPVGYHGRSGTVVVSGTPVRRPRGLVCDGAEPSPQLAPVAARPQLVPTAMLDFELEVGFVVGGPPATRVAPDDADRHVAGAVLVNDWSARDIQAFEYQPLGPHLSKSFATTVSPWLVTLDALRPFLVDAPPQDPSPHPYLQAAQPWALDLDLEARLDDTVVTATNFAGMYWTFAQQLAHLTVNGATVRAGDLFASGTVSGPERTEWGSLMELTWRGRDPIVLAGGARRGFLADGDTVTINGWGREAPGRPRIGFGDATGTVLPATPPDPGGPR